MGDGDGGTALVTEIRGDILKEVTQAAFMEKPPFLLRTFICVDKC